MFIIPFPIIDPIAAFVRDVPIRWYNIAYMTGMIISYGQLNFIIIKYHEQMYYHSTYGSTPNKNSLLYILPIIIISIIVGGRLGYVILYQPIFYINNISEVIFIWKGGMSFYGGVITTIITTYYFCKKKKFLFL